MSAIDDVMTFAIEARSELAALRAERDALRDAIAEIKEQTLMPDGTRLSDAVKSVMQERDALKLQVETLRAACEKTMAAYYHEFEYPHDGCDCEDCDAARSNIAALAATAPQVK